MKTVEFKLRDVKHVFNTFCGPSVVSSLTGLGTDVVEKHFKNLLGDIPIKGVYTHDLLKVLGVFGIEGYYTPIGERKSLRYFIDNPKRELDKIYLVVSGNHFQLIQGKRFVCSLTQKAVSINSSKIRTRTKVRSVYVLWADKVNIPSANSTFKDAVKGREIIAQGKRDDINHFNKVKREVTKRATSLGLVPEKVTRTSYKIRVPEERKDRFKGYLGCFYPSHIVEHYESQDWDYELDYLLGVLKSA